MNDAATEATKTALENSITWYLADKLELATTQVATKKYLTGDNLLVYLTQSLSSALTIPRYKVQVLWRVNGGVHETDYLLFADHRFTKTDNDMVFGAETPGAADGSQATDVSEDEAARLLTLVNSLQNARQTL